jgi:disease resistance protein RPM1
VFDDVWNVHFWNEVESAVIDNKNGSKIFITTRNIDVAISCKKSSFVEVHELQPLTQEQSLELFNKKVFQFDFDGCCPKELIDISFEIVKKCKGLPLAIVAIGGLLSTKDKNTFEWKRFSENLRLELKKDSHLIGIQEILSLSYDDLPYRLKLCLLYFGIYPEDYEIESNRLFGQWIAEGFVKEERGKTLEDVAEGYLIELIRRSLVQVSSISIDGKVECCHVHDLIRVMILDKFDDFNFCHHISEYGQSFLSGTIRRLSIASISGDLMDCSESSHVRSLLVFTDKELPEHFVRRITTKYKQLKVIDFKDVELRYVPENLGGLIHLKFLSLRNNRHIKSLPKSISMLQNLETFDLRDTGVREMPKEISKLRKLRHLLGDRMSLIQLKNCIGCITSLQTLHNVSLDGDGAGVVELITELGKLKELRELGLVGIVREHGSYLSTSINEMKCLEKLDIESKSKEKVIDLHLISSPPPMLRNLTLSGKLEKFPEWIPELQNLVELRLVRSQLTDNPMKSLKNMKNLLSLFISDCAYEGESLHFQDEEFHKLKELCIANWDNLSSMVIEKGALHSLKMLTLYYIPQLKTVPIGIQHLEKLEVLRNWYMPTELVESVSSDGGKEHWIIDHVPLVEFRTLDGTFIRHSKT